MIQIEEDIGAVTIVGEEEVSALTSAGYLLKGVVQETRPEAVFPCRQDLNPGVNGCIGMYSMRPQETEYIPVSKSRYILALPRDKANQQLKEEMDNLLTKVGTQEKALADSEFKRKEAQSQLTEALATCKEFAIERETKNQLLTENLAAKLALQEDLKTLRDTSKNVERLMALEDWVTRLTRALDPKILQDLNLGPCPFMHPKTWAERLIEDER